MYGVVDSHRRLPHLRRGWCGGGVAGTLGWSSLVDTTSMSLRMCVKMGDASLWMALGGRGILGGHVWLGGGEFATHSWLQGGVTFESCRIQMSHTCDMWLML
eukprot:365364-Chlamydomonas_euryale.AAC.5